MRLAHQGMLEQFVYSSFPLMDFLRLNKFHLIMKMHLLISCMLVAWSFCWWHIFFPHFSLMNFLLLLMMKMYLLTWIVLALVFELCHLLYLPFFLNEFLRFHKLPHQMIKMYILTCWKRQSCVATFGPNIRIYEIEKVKWNMEMNKLTKIYNDFIC